MALFFKDKIMPKNAGINIEASEEITDIQKAIDKDSIHDIFPFSWEMYPTYVQSGENFIRVLAVVDYPEKAYGNWLSELRRKKNNIHIVQYIESSNSAEMQQYYKKTIENKETELLKTYDPLKKKTLQKQIDSANFQLDKYLDNATTFVYQYTYVFLRANTLKELDNLTATVKNTLVKLQLKTITPVKATFQAFWSAMPIGENLLGEYTYKESNTVAASSMIPFDDGEILNLNARSDIEGINKDTGSLIAIDKLNRNMTLNQNEVVIGTSGVGKTTYLIQKILRYVTQGYRVYIIDPEDEYTDIVNFLGGSVLHLSSNSSHKINPLQIFTEELLNDEQETITTITDMERLVKDKIQRFKGFLEVIKSDITQVEKAIMDEVVKQAYINRGIMKYGRVSEIRPEQWPVLSDVLREMENLKKNYSEKFTKVENLYFILESYTTGSNTLFNGYTNVNVKGKLLAFNLKPLQTEKEVQAAAYLNTFEFLWDEITKDRTEVKKLFVDEFHFLTLHPQSANFFYQAYKRFRKYKAGAIAGTQQIQDVSQGELVDGKNVGEAIVGNSYTKVFFGLDNKGVEDVVEKLQLNFSKKEKKLLSKKKQGEAIIMYGSQRAFMKVELTEEELRLIDPEKYKEIYHRETDAQPDYEKRIKFSDREIEEIEQYILSV